MSKLRHIPNLICFVRILLVAPAVWALLDGRYPLALGLIVIAGLSDALDGYLARRFDWRSRLGALLDPAADKFLVASVFVTLTWLGFVPVWFTAVVLGRDVLIVAGVLAHQLWLAPVHGKPTAISKLNTTFQIVFMVLTITHAWLGWPAIVWLQLLGAALLWTIAASAFQYVKAGCRAAWESRGARGT
ncbi:MAG: CDP-alcohol phosphatidyltransferase family protein [Myxococcales bacterium]|nr:CDP-alcohol phosphatidyltransferase family protein [Myxococcales bacterium]MDH3483242.1 CDP-alcohol phosphatidyltransferase family protein [Myxococcales bacterium]